MTATQPALFADCPPAPPTRRGWAALPLVEHVVQVDDASATGRHKLTFRYRRLQSWTDGQVDAATRLITLYFQHFGGFRLADQAVLRAWIDALDLYSEEEVRWALRAKWRSIQGATVEERRDKRKFVARPDTFPLTIGHWLEQSPEHQQRTAAAREAEHRRALDAVCAARASAPNPSVPQSLNPCAEDAARAQRVEERRASAAQTREQLAARNADYWGGLSDAQRGAAMRATDPAWKERCREWQMNPEDPQLDLVRRDWARKWAELKWPPREVAS